MSDAFDLFEIERLEDEFFFDSIPEFGREFRFSRAQNDAFGILFRDAGVIFGEANGALNGVGEVLCAKVTRQDDDGIGEIDVSTFGIGESAFVEDLEQDIPNIWMGFFDFVE